MSTTNRGQAHTLEGVVAGIVLLGGVVFALQVTTVTPLSASTSNKYVENQLGASAEGALAAAAENGSLKTAVLYWNETNKSFNNTGDEDWYESPDPPPNKLIDLLERAFEGQGVAYNVYVTYPLDGESRKTRMLYQGAPSDNAISTSRAVTLYDDDELSDNSTALTDSTTFFARDVSTDSPLYSVVRVEVVVWRM